MSLLRGVWWAHTVEEARNHIKELEAKLERVEKENKELREIIEAYDRSMVKANDLLSKQQKRLRALEAEDD